MRNRSNVVVGLIFVILGVVFFLRQLGFVKFEIDIGYMFVYFWPMFLILPGLAFHYAFFEGNGKEPGLVVPGGILLVCGLTCQVGMLTGSWDIVWPGFILSVSVGLFELYIYGGREKGLLIPVGILGALSLLFFSREAFKWMFSLTNQSLFISIILIVFGFLIIFKRK